MNEKEKSHRSCALGDLIVELFDQAKEVTGKHKEQSLLVAETVRHLLSNEAGRRLKTSS